ncbi:response regulator transcription factor [Actinoalloteichus hymeniacidonis]|uniref:Two component transcriptional regulator, LuxR family n=1 Tax=Actinoalloteichus hymeniacidonis TaxID=340345 RepID=A0AAC9HL71_9PSEU|nr:response regulator transcription factor [Actinoalloteichus hymeniacidonis]AOS61422.1 two component transcriptional regulator, LuxR family [Actinoalloteichus hymeniacidonis]MBB5910572.1 two-component system response regulator DesR [Actinoalloteichus hymeniacidonis]
MIRVVLADDEQLTRDAVAALLSLEPDLDVVGQAADGVAALRLVGELSPDIVVLDVEMPGVPGPDVVERITGMGVSTRCVIITRHARPGVLRRSLEVGARGFLPKDVPVSRLAEAIRRVHSGGRYVDPDMAADSLAQSACPLTIREREVLAMVADARSGADIARSVHLSSGTVRNYLSSAMTKLSARSRAEAARIARDRGWI